MLHPPTHQRPRVRYVRRARLAPGRLIDTDSKVADLLDPVIAVPTKTDTIQLQSADYSITINWDCLGADQVTMPSQGEVERRGGMVDVYLNDHAYWKDIPVNVWEYRLGGYQVLKKWLT